MDNLVHFKGQEQVNLALMQLDDLDEIMQLEESVFFDPWSRTMFQDCLAQEYPVWIMRNQEKKMMAYMVVMQILDEVHILNICVDKALQRLGWGTFLLQEIIHILKNKKVNSILLEVRVSNEAAIGLYSKLGFLKIGVRKGYYPAKNNEREDAIVMRLTL
jgi:ribosomal-protein-alanine N-acetyltransferase